MRRTRRTVFVGLLAVFLFALASPADAVDKICLDFAGIDARADLTAQQKTDLKAKIKQVAVDNLGADYQVVSGNTDCAGAKRTIHFKEGAHDPDDRYGDWPAGSSDVNVYVGAFMDDAGVSGEFKNGAAWDLDKLANGLGETGCHECGHSYSVGHNTHSPPDKMTDGAGVTAAQRAAGGRHFDEPAKKVLEENLGKDPCKTATDYDEKAVLSHIHDPVPLGPNKEEDAFDVASRHADAGLTVVGSLPGHFFGYVAGSADAPFFVAKSSLESGFQMDHLTWFQFGASHASLISFAVAPSGSGAWVHPDAIDFANPTTAPGGQIVYRQLTLSWFGLGVTVSLDAALHDPLAANGWAPGCGQPGDCNDQDPCTSDVCNGNLGCHHDPGPGMSCFDGVPCHQQGRCDPAAPGANPVTGCYFPDACEDAGPCALASCDVASGTCIFSPPPPLPEVTTLSVGLPSKTSLSWSAVPGASTYQLVRGRLNALPVGPGGLDESCFGGVAGSSVGDAQNPPPGQGFWYVVRPFDGCVPGPYGLATSGPRVTASCENATRFRDEVDSGDDPLVGGCHYRYSDATCGSGRTFYSADHCIGPTTLVEWIDTSCHPGENDTRTVDCVQFCVNLHFDGGVCTNGLGICPLNGWIPARCACM